MIKQFSVNFKNLVSIFEIRIFLCIRINNIKNLLTLILIFSIQRRLLNICYVYLPVMQL